MCNCMTMCRVPDVETENGRWPIPEHAPSCEDFKQERYIRLYDADGENSFIDTQENQYSYMASDEFKGSGLRQEDVYLTDDQFESLPEFQGI